MLLNIDNVVVDVTVAGLDVTVAVVDVDVGVAGVVVSYRKIAMSLWCRMLLPLLAMFKPMFRYFYFSCLACCFHDYLCC